MRVTRKEIHERGVMEELLAGSDVGRLGTIGRDGYPMVKPLNFAYYRDRIYFHSAREGEKIEAIRRDSRVCFEADLPIAYVKSAGDPCKAGYHYRSVIIKGRAHVVADREERVSALMALMRKYQPEGGYGGFSEERLARTAVVRIDIVEMTGKQDLGRESERDTVLRLPEEGSAPAAASDRSCEPHRAWHPVVEQRK